MMMMMMMVSRGEHLTVIVKFSTLDTAFLAL